MFTIAKRIWNVLFPRKSQCVVKVSAEELNASLQKAMQGIEDLVAPEVVPIVEPATINAHISNYRNKRYSESMTIGHNWTKPELKYLPEVNSNDKIWVYNVSRMPFEISSHPIVGNIKIPGRKIGDQYSVWTSFPKTMRVPKYVVDSDEIDFSYLDGRRFAMDLINPDNFGIDQNQKTRGFGVGIGRDLGAKGVFWSESNPPTKEEILAARKRMRDLYKLLLEQIGTKIFTSGMSFNEKVSALVKKYKDEKVFEKLKTLELRRMAKNVILHQLNITPEHHAAAEFYGLTTEWHPVLLDKKKK